MSALKRPRPAVAQVVVTGATGFIGQHLLSALSTLGHRIRVLSRSGRLSVHAPDIDCTRGCLEDRSSLEALVEGADAIIHLAGATAAKTRADYFKSNAAGTTQLIAATRAQAPKARFVHVSSLAARAPTLSNYAASKWAGEAIVRGSRLDWTVVRPPAVYGANDTAMRPLWQMLKRGWVPRLGAANARFSLLHVSDLSQALALLVEPDVFAAAAGHCIELDDGHQRGPDRGYGWQDLAAVSQTLTHRPARVVRLPQTGLALAAYLSALGGRVRGQTPVFNPDKLGELRHDNWVCRPHDAAWLPGWSPRRRLGDTLLDEMKGTR